MDDYPMQTAQVRMLKIVQERIEQAYEGGQLQARIDINQVIALGDELGISEGAAVAMFCRLGDEGYFVATGLNKPFNHGFDRYPFMWANVDRLTTKGLLEIGELPDARERLIRVWTPRSGQLREKRSRNRRKRSVSTGLKRARSWSGP